MPHVTSVIFDLGGVLLDWDPPAIAAAVFADPLVQGRVLRAVFAHQDWVDLDRGVLGEEDALGRFAARSGQSLAHMAALMDQVRVGLRPRPASLALLAELRDRGVALYCLSNMHARSIPYLRQRLAFLEWFRGVVFSAEERLVKPDPAIYRLLLERFGVRPETTAFVDDSPANVAAAGQLGLHGVLYTRLEDCRRALDALLADGRSPGR